MGLFLFRRWLIYELDVDTDWHGLEWRNGERLTQQRVAVENNQKAMTKRVSEVERWLLQRKERGGSGHFMNGPWTTTGEMRGALASQHGEGVKAAPPHACLGRSILSRSRAHGRPHRPCNEATNYLARTSPIAQQAGGRERCQSTAAESQDWFAAPIASIGATSGARVPMKTANVLLQQLPRRDGFSG